MKRTRKHRTLAGPGAGAKAAGCGCAGFSLVEVVVAIGIVATAVLPLIALMALGVKANRESGERSRAAMIAESIFAELRQSSADSGPILRVKRDGPVDGQYWDAPGTPSSLPGKAVYVGYDGEGQVVSEFTQGDYEQGATGAPIEVMAMVMVSFEKATSGGNFYRDAGSQIVESEGLIKVVVSVEFPVLSRAENRYVYRFVSYMNLTDGAEKSAAA